MGFNEEPVVWIDREPTLDEEISALGDEDVFEMANLVEAQTGVPGTIFISTVMGSHGPRVKYYPHRGGAGAQLLGRHRLGTASRGQQFGGS